MTTAVPSIRDAVPELFAGIEQRGGGVLSRELAIAVLQMDFRPDDHRRMKRLATKNSAGRITAPERDELTAYVRAGELLGVLQSRARRVLAADGDL